jgi:hypothetical protein
VVVLQGVDPVFIPRCMTVAPDMSLILALDVNVEAVTGMDLGSQHQCGRQSKESEYGSMDDLHENTSLAWFGCVWQYLEAGGR